MISMIPVFFPTTKIERKVGISEHSSKISTFLLCRFLLANQTFLENKKKLFQVCQITSMNEGFIVKLT